jgi:hypothetical protein
MRVIGLYPSQRSGAAIPPGGLVFPVAPGTLSVTTSGNYVTHDYVNRGTVNRFVGEQPRVIQWDSMLPRSEGIIPPGIPGTFRPPDEIRSILYQAMDSGSLPMLRFMEYQGGTTYNLYMPQTVRVDSFQEVDRGGNPNLVFYSVSVTEVFVKDLKQHYLMAPSNLGNAGFTWSTITDETIIGAGTPDAPPPSPPPATEPPPPQPDKTEPIGQNVLKLTRDAIIERKRNERVSAALKRVYKREFPARWANIVMDYNSIDNAGYPSVGNTRPKRRKPNANPVKFVIVPAIVFGPGGPFGVWSGAPFG